MDEKVRRRWARGCLGASALGLALALSGCVQPHKELSVLESVEADMEEKRRSEERRLNPYNSFAQPIISTDLKETYPSGSNVTINVVWTGNRDIVIITNLLSVTYRVDSGDKTWVEGRFQLKDRERLEYPDRVPLGQVNCGPLPPGKYLLVLITVAKTGYVDTGTHTRTMNLPFEVVGAAERACHVLTSVCHFVGGS